MTDEEKFEEWLEKNPGKDSEQCFLAGLAEGRAERNEPLFLTKEGMKIYLEKDSEFQSKVKQLREKIKSDINSFEKYSEMNHSGDINGLTLALEHITDIFGMEEK